MPVFQLSDELIFPPTNLAEEDGLLAVGGDLSPERLLLAYQAGIFPWFNQEDPILWWSPDPRCVLKLSDLKVSKSLKQTLRKNIFKVTFDQYFSQVITQCKSIPRKDQEGTWITGDIKKSYEQLHTMGYAHSVEVLDIENKLVGGLYGVSLGNIFFGESMFSKESNASKVALYYLVEKLKLWNFELIDCQIPNPHLESLGASMLSGEVFREKLKGSMSFETKKGKWNTIS